MKNISTKSILSFVGCFFISFSFAQNWDVNTLNSINPPNPNATIWRGATKTLYPIAVGIPSATLLIGYIQHNESTQQKGWEMVGSLAINTVITQGLKYTVNRQRPYSQYPTLVTPYESTEADKSFPSGHTSTAFALATTLSLQNKQWYIIVPAYAWATSVGYSRLYLGEHFPTDVLAGAVVGVGSAWLGHWLSHKYFATHNSATTLKKL